MRCHIEAKPTQRDTRKIKIDLLVAFLKARYGLASNFRGKASPEKAQEQENRIRVELAVAGTRDFLSHNFLENRPNNIEDAKTIINVLINGGERTKKIDLYANMATKEAIRQKREAKIPDNTVSIPKITIAALQSIITPSNG